MDSTQARCELLHSEPLFERSRIDDAAAMGAVADFAAAIPSLDLEYNAFGADLDDARNRADRPAHGSCGEVADLDVHADADETCRQMRSDGVARRHFHVQDHHRRSI